jgi:hypothetical protein
VDHQPIGAVPRRDLVLKSLNAIFMAKDWPLERDAHLVQAAIFLVRSASV